MQIISERLKELREEKQISMFSLAQQIGVSDAAICKWENEITEPKASNVKILAEFFEVSTDYLLGFENENGIKKFSAPLKKVPALSTKAQELVDIFNALDSMHQVQVLEYARYFAERSGKKIKKF